MNTTKTMANYYNRFLTSVSKWPDQVAVELQHQSADEPADRYTYAELRQMSDEVARWMVQSGVPRGSRCIMLAANGPRWLAVFMGVLAAGCVVVPLDTAFNAEQVHKLAGDSGSLLAFADEKHLPTAEKGAEGLGVRVVSIDADGKPLSELLAAAPADTAIPVEVADDEIAALLYSSGTTGDPKGVMLTHANFSAEMDAIFKAFTIGPEDSMLGVLPLFHALALVITLLLPLTSGSRILFLESLNTTDLMRALPRVNIFICVPQFFYLIHERLWKEVSGKGKAAENAFRALLKISYFGRRFGLNLGKVFFGKVHKLMGENMRYLGSGGSKLDPEIGREFEALGFTMLQGYGLTETTGCATYTPPGQIDIATIGKPLPGMEVKIIASEVAEGSEPRAHADGEICIRGGIVM
ncbi:MAG TPA: AMP-binding protein, partial [Terriglobales bacterium]|nr:AMP-binding protein [Terriglobales bacterium]